MTRHKDREFGQDLYERVERITAVTAPRLPDFSYQRQLEAQRAKELRKMKKFRFQLLHRWLTEHLPPCRVADIAGGKGLLAHLLQQSGWPATVIDPTYQPLPDKYKDIATGQRVRLNGAEQVRHIARPFTRDMGQQFDLLVGMHAHGCNIAIIEAAASYGCGFVLFPCCVIDEPLIPPPGVHWLESLADYAVQKGVAVAPFRLNFKGQNIGLYGLGDNAPVLPADRPPLAP
jgi:hypothetical protein